MRGASLLCAVLLLSGCSFAPTYRVPPTVMPAQFKEAGDWVEATPLDTAPRGPWWNLFADPQLDALEAQLDAQNPSLAAAAARKAEADALLAQARAARFPTVNANADISRNQVPATRPLVNTGNSATYASEDFGGSLSYEVDLWGRVRNSIAAGRGTAAASAADYAALKLALEAQLAASYFALRGLDDEIALLKKTIETDQRAFELTKIRHEGGIASGLDEGRSRTQLATAKAQLDDVVATRAITEHAVAVLAGVLPSSLTVAAKPGQVPLPAVTLAPPSTLLQRRPDIAAAERRMYAANAQIGVAKAAFFPSLTLSASAGYLTTGNALFDAPNAFWALGPASTLLNVLDGGKRRAVTRQARASFDEAAANYRATVLAAFQDVENALAKLHHLQLELANQHEAAQAAEATLDLALIQYHDGAASFLDVVTAQTTALDAGRAEVALRTRLLQARVDLVRALGGDASPAASGVSGAN